MDENKIVIVSDDNNVISFDDITIKHDTVDRNEVAEVEKEIEMLEVEIDEKNKRLVELKAKIKYAKKIIAIADAEKVAEVEVPAVENNENVDGDEIQADEVEV